MVAPGIHYGLGMEQYHAWRLEPAKLAAGPISCSMLKEFAPNPFAWLLSPPRAQTPAMAKGRLFDLAVTDRATLEQSVEVSRFDNFRSNAAKEWRDEAISAGKIVVDQEDIDHALKAARIVGEHPTAGEILRDAQFQVGVVGEIEGIPAKCLLDILPGQDGDWCETVVDYKTTSNGLDDESIRRTIGGFKYHWQAAFYLNLFEKVSPDRVATDFAFIFQDVKTLEVRVVKLGDEALAMGTRAIRQAVADFIRCSKRGIKSRYLKTADSLDLLPFHSAADEEWVMSMQEGRGA